MASKTGYSVAGYEFKSIKDAELAREEEKKIIFIKSKLNYDDPGSVKIIYDKMIKNRIFTTPVGMDFLKELHGKLIESGKFNADELSSIPLYVAYSSSPLEELPLPSRKVVKQKEEIRDYKTEYNICKFIIALLLVAIGAMFYITLQGDNPNVLNYETAIRNKYSSWEMELTEREKEIRARERELGLESTNFEDSYEE